MADERRKGPPRIDKLKGEVLEKPFSELDEFIEDLSGSAGILSIEKRGQEERMPSDAENIETEMEPDEDMEETMAPTENWQDFKEEYGDEELDEDEVYPRGLEDEQGVREIERDYDSEGIIVQQDPEMEIIKDSEGFKVKINTSDVTGRFRFRRTGDIYTDNAGMAVLGALSYREEILERIGSYLIENLSDYFNKLSMSDRHWYQKPLRMSQIMGPQHKASIARVVKGTIVLLPNGEQTELRGFFDDTGMPINSRSIAIEIRRLLQSEPDMTNKNIAEEIEKKARKHNLDIHLTEPMIRYWRKKYALRPHKSKKT